MPDPFLNTLTGSSLSRYLIYGPFAEQIRPEAMGFDARSLLFSARILRLYYCRIKLPIIYITSCCINFSNLSKLLMMFQISYKRGDIVSRSKNTVFANMKQSVAKEVGVNLKQGYNGDLTSWEAGKIGGRITQKVFEAYTSNR